MVSDKVIGEMAQRLVEKFDPLKIVLFGSHARGDARTHSDVDLLVIMPDGTHTRKAAISMLSELRNADAATDVVVATPHTLRAFGDSVGMVYRPALREGKTIYERG